MGSTVFFVAVMSILARALSLVSTQVYMWSFGARDVQLSIFAFALLMPNTLFTSLGTSITTVVIPVYSSLLSQKKDKDAKHFIDNLLTVSSVLLLVLVMVGLLAAPFILQFTDYKNDAANYAYALKGLRILLPVMFFYGLNYIFQGVLQSHGRFNTTALVTLPSSITMLAYVLLLGGRFGVDGLFWAALVGLSLQAVFLMPSLYRTGYRYRPVFDLGDKELSGAAGRIPPVLLGALAYQFNMFVNGSLATRFNTLMLMTYVQNLILSSMLTFVYAIANVYYPRFSALWSVNDIEGYSSAVSQVIKTLMFLLIPAAFGIILVREEIISLIADWGNFGSQNVTVAANIMAFYAMGMLGVAVKEILDRAFYAQKDTKTSAIIGLAIMAVNVAMSFILISTMGTYAMPFAFSVASTIGAAIMLWRLIKRIGNLDKRLIGHTVKCFLCAGIMTAAILSVRKLMIFASVEVTGDGLIPRLIRLLIPTVTGVACYFAAARLMKVEYLQKKGEQC